MDVTARIKRRSASRRVGPSPAGTLNEAWRRRAAAKMYVTQPITVHTAGGYGWTNSVFMSTLRRLRSW